MKQSRALLVAVFVALVLGGLLGAVLTAHAQQLTAAAIDRLRFRMIGDEPIATPDGKSVVSGWKATVIRDLKSDQCYVTFIAGTAIGVTGPSVCP